MLLSDGIRRNVKAFDHTWPDRADPGFEPHANGLGPAPRLVTRTRVRAPVLGCWRTPQIDADVHHAGEISQGDYSVS